MITLLATVLGASLLGSLHCAGMCGPLVAFAVSGDSRLNGHPIALNTAYHLGRLATYLVIGAVCGAVGAALDQGGLLVGLQSAAAIVGGALMIAIGVVAGLRQLGVGIASTRTPAFVQKLIATGHRAAAALPPTQRALAIGLLSGLLPCGWLWVFALTAAGTGSAVWGALTMLAFWLGTVPILLGLGLSVQRLTALLGRRLPAATAILVILLGVLTAAQRMSLPAFAGNHPSAATSVEDATDRAAHANDDLPPCCREK